MRTKKRIVVVVILVVLIILTGCINKPVDQNQPTDKPTGNSPGTTVTPSQGITVNNIDFKEVSLNELTPEKIELINQLVLLKGYYYWVDSNGLYTMYIGMGEKPTGGYSIKVLSVEDNEGKTNILVEETIPGTDENVSQALTYPYVVIEMKGITDRFTIMTTNKDEYKLVNNDELKVLTITGIYQGQIDNNSIEVKIGDSYMVFRNPEMTTLIAGLKKDDSVIITYKTSTEGQYIIESINLANGEIQIIEGVYQGQIDNNSIEVKIGDSYMVFRNPEITSLIAGLKKDDSVIIIYKTSTEGQHIIESINLANGEIQIIEGVYQGQIDNNSIEVKIGDSYMVFRNSEMSKFITDYKKDDLIIITYSTSQEGQYMLLNIEPRK